LSNEKILSLCLCSGDARCLRAQKRKLAPEAMPLIFKKY
jgi:hypothetical protein